MDSFNFQPYKSIVFELYQQVSIAAGFNLIELHPDYFQTLLEHCSDNFGLKIIFYQSKPIAFYSYIIDGEVFQAHFIGYERSYNNNLELYHNILLRLLQTAINVKAKEINFARTALEIKSSVGAEPHDLFCYIAHKSKIINSVVPHILEFLKPKDDWIQRRPFKDSNLVVNPLLKVKSGLKANFRLLTLSLAMNLRIIFAAIFITLSTVFNLTAQDEPPLLSGIKGNFFILNEGRDSMEFAGLKDSQSQLIFCLFHAEEDPIGLDPGLSTDGRWRALNLLKILKNIELKAFLPPLFETTFLPSNL